MKIKLTSVYVDDQEKALRFYTEVLGFVKKADVSQGPYRWLTVASPEEPEGTELQLALNDNPAARAYQQAMFQQDQPAAMFFTDDVQADYERRRARTGGNDERKEGHAEVCQEHHRERYDVQGIHGRGTSCDEGARPGAEGGSAREQGPGGRGRCRAREDRRDAGTGSSHGRAAP